MSDTRHLSTALAQLPDARRGTFFDRALQQLIPQLCLPGEAALDLGAGWGSYTRAMLEGVGPFGRVLAFEPNPEVCRSLQDLAMRDFRLRVFPQALSNTNRSSQFYRLADSGLSSLRERHYLRVPVVDRIEVKVTRLDDCPAVAALSSISFMRIDVEGEELQLLEGARETIHRTEPVIALELDWYRLFRAGQGDEHSFFRLLDSLGGSGYELLDFGGDLVKSYTDSAWNVLLVSRRAVRKDRLVHIFKTVADNVLSEIV
jgi:FkbM family methyltransferase